jgi:hypothetical protein
MLVFSSRGTLKVNFHFEGQFATVVKVQSSWDDPVGWCMAAACL